MNFLCVHSIDQAAETYSGSLTLRGSSVKVFASSLRKTLLKGPET